MRPEEVAQLDPYRVRSEEVVSDAKELLEGTPDAPSVEPSPEDLPTGSTSSSRVPYVPPPGYIPDTEKIFEEYKKEPLSFPISKENFKNNIREHYFEKEIKDSKNRY